MQKIYILRMLISAKYILHVNILLLISFIGLMDIYLKKIDYLCLIVLCVIC